MHFRRILIPVDIYTSNNKLTQTGVIELLKPLKTNPLAPTLIYPFLPFGDTISSTELAPDPLPAKPDPIAVVRGPDGEIPDPERLIKLLPFKHVL